MATPYLIIDGYNLIHAAGLARPSYGPGDLERCRHRLLRLLVNYLTDRELERAKVVFDAIEAPAGLPNRMKFEGLQVRFADPGGDADSLIEELILEHSSPRQIIVVSGDRRLQKAAHRRRARFIGSVEFLDEVLERSPRRDREEAPLHPHPKYDGELSPGELEQWLGLFEDVGKFAQEEQEKLSSPPVEPEQSAKKQEQHEPQCNDETPDADDEWTELYAELGMLEAELAQEVTREDTLKKLQAEIDRMIEEEHGSLG